MTKACSESRGFRLSGGWGDRGWPWHEGAGASDGQWQQAAAVGA